MTKLPQLGVLLCRQSFAEHCKIFFWWHFNKYSSGWRHRATLIEKASWSLTTRIINKLIHRSSRLNDFEKHSQQQRNCYSFLIDRSLHQNYDCNDNFLLLLRLSSFWGHVGIFPFLFPFEGFIEITKQVKFFVSSCWYFFLFRLTNDNFFFFYR